MVDAADALGAEGEAGAGGVLPEADVPGAAAGVPGESEGVPGEPEGVAPGVAVGDSGAQTISSRGV